MLISDIANLIIKKLLKYISVLFIGICSGMILLNAVYTLPADIMRGSLKRSESTIENEQTYSRIGASQIDNYTDSIMLSNAVYSGNESLIERSVKVYRNTMEDKDPHETLAVQLSETEQEFEKLEYSRYWHGYLIILKPLLLIFSYNDIRTLNTVMLTLIILLVCTLMYKNGKGMYIVPYIISVIFINPAAIVMSLHFSTIFYVYNISMAFVLYAEIKNRKYDELLFFMIVGMATSYFDFLTYPIASFGMPMITLLILNDSINISGKIKKIFKSGIFWMIGYIGMWFGKWFSGSILLHENLFSKALSFVDMRTSNTVFFNDKPLSFAYSILSNLKIIFENRVYLIFTVIILIYSFIKIKKRGARLNAETLKAAIPFLFVCIMPFVWYSLTVNHSSIHCWFTYRALSVTVFGISSMFVYMIDKDSLFSVKDKIKRIT